MYLISFVDAAFNDKLQELHCRLLASLSVAVYHDSTYLIT
jgi:hypothetical protein